MMKFTILRCYRDASGTGFRPCFAIGGEGALAGLDRIGDRPLRTRACMCPDRRVSGLKASVQRDLRHHHVCDEPVVPVHRQTPVFADSLTP
jgi:hypothetical protein